MKKLLAVLIFVLLISGCSNKYDGWKEIEVPEVGSFRIPGEWVCNKNDETICFTDKDIDDSSEYKIYLMGAIYEEGQTEIFYQFQGQKVEYREQISSETFSNSVIIGKNEYLIGDELCEMLFLDAYSSDKRLFLIACDESLEYDVVEKIGKSFAMNIES